MANILNKDPFTYNEEYTEFIKELRQYHNNRGTPFRKIPQIAGRDVDLYLLYRRVISYGGWQKVNEEQNWDELFEEFNIPKGCTNGIQAIKQIYIRFLNEYEKVNFLGEDPDHEIMDDDEDGPSRKKSSTPLHSVPLTYKYNQHKVSESARQNAGLSCQFVTFSDYDKLEMALMSGLPNEVDFVVNVCTLLSNDGKRSLRLDKSKHLLDLLLAHIGIFSLGDSSLEELYENGWRPFSKRNFVKFWYDTVNDKEVREMISDTRDASLIREWVGEEVLNLGRSLGVTDVEGQRVTQMAIIVRNLSFDEENLQILANNRSVFRFLLLCAYSKYGSLRQIGLDTLGNSALQMILESVDHPDTQLILRLISKCLCSSDKCEVVRGLEILSKLCQVEENESLLSEHLESKAYEDICKLLTIHDIQLIIYTLETLYQLSELGEATSGAISSVKHAVDILVQLVTVEAQSYGPNSLIGIKVVEFVPHQQTGFTAIGPPVPPQPPPPITMNCKTVPQPNSIPTSEIETTCNWLRANLELRDGCYMSHLSLYTDYLSFCKKFSLPNPLNSSVLHTCVKAVFPNVEEKIIERKDGNKDIQFSGFSKRSSPLPFAITWQGSSSSHSSQLPGGQHPTSLTPATTPHNPKGHHGQSNQQKHCAKILQSPGTPSRNLANPLPPTPSTPLSRTIVVSAVSTSTPNLQCKTVSVLQQQLRSPIAQQSLKLQDSPLNPQTPLTAQNPSYPCIQHALHVESDQNQSPGITPLRQQTKQQNLQSKTSLFQDNVGAPGNRLPSDTNLIKTLLAKKLNQNRGAQSPSPQLPETPLTISSVSNAPPSPARSDAAMSQDGFPSLETTKPNKQNVVRAVTVPVMEWHPPSIDSPAPSDTMESQTSISQDSCYTTEDQSQQSMLVSNQESTLKEALSQQTTCDSTLRQEENMETDSQQTEPDIGQDDLQDDLNSQSLTGNLMTTSNVQQLDLAQSLDSQLEKPDTVRPVEQPFFQQTTQQESKNMELSSTPATMQAAVAVGAAVVQGAQNMQQAGQAPNPVLLQTASKAALPGTQDSNNGVKQDSTDLVIQLNSGASLQQQEVIVQPIPGQLNNQEALVVQAKLHDQQDVMQAISSPRPGEPFVIQGSQILLQQQPAQGQQQPSAAAQQQLVIQMPPSQPGQPVQAPQQLVIQTSPATLQTQQLVIQVPQQQQLQQPQQQQFVIQAQQQQSTLQSQQIVIRDLPESNLANNQQTLSLETSQIFGSSCSLSDPAAPVNSNPTAPSSLPLNTLSQINDGSLQQNEVIIQYRPVSQVLTTASTTTTDITGTNTTTTTTTAATTSTIFSKVSPVSPGETSLDSNLSPQTLTKCVFQSQGPLFPPSQNMLLENSQKMKKGRVSPVKNFTSLPGHVSTPKLVTSNCKSLDTDPALSNASSPQTAQNFELEVCGEVECAKDIVKVGSEARIERVENKCLKLLEGGTAPATTTTTSTTAAAAPEPSSLDKSDVVSIAKELPPSTAFPNILLTGSGSSDGKNLLLNHTDSIPANMDVNMDFKVAEPSVAFVYSMSNESKKNVDALGGSNGCHSNQQSSSSSSLSSSSTYHSHKPLPTDAIKEELGEDEEKPQLGDDGVVGKREVSNSNTVCAKQEKGVLIEPEVPVDGGKTLGDLKLSVPSSSNTTTTTTCESPKPNRTSVTQVNGSTAVTTTQCLCPHSNNNTNNNNNNNEALVDTKVGGGGELLHNGVTSASNVVDVKLNFDIKSEDLGVVGEKILLSKPVEKFGSKVNGILNHLGSSECNKSSLDTKLQLSAENQKERKRKASVSSLSSSSSSNSSSSVVVGRVPENGCVVVVNGLQETVGDCKFLIDNNNIEQKVSATHLSCGAKKQRQTECSGSNCLKNKKSDKPNSTVLCSHVNRTCESRLVPASDSGDGDISCDSSSVSSVQDAFEKQHSNFNQGTLLSGGTLLYSKDSKDTALRPAQSISPKGVPGSGADKLVKARKRIRNNTGSADSRCSPSVGSEFVCEWASCKRCFETSKGVYSHVYSAHVMAESDGVCKWEGCEKLERKKWSLVTHIQDQHCSEAVLRAAAQRRIQSAQMNLPGAVAHAAPPSQSQPPLLPPLQVSPAAAASVISAPCVSTAGSGVSGGGGGGGVVVGSSGLSAAAAAAAAAAAVAAPGSANLVYPPDAAIQAIRRFSARPPFPELMPTNFVPHSVHHYPRYDYKPRNADYVFPTMPFGVKPMFQEAREGPVTKHIRLTAALILRNLSRYSTLGRRLMKKHETYLGYTAMSAVESSNALANCLWEILEHH